MLIWWFFSVKLQSKFNKSKFNKFLQTYIIFLITHLFLIFFNKDIFFQENIEMELKIFLIVLEEFSEWQK